MVYALQIDDPRVNPAAKFSSISQIVNLLIPNLLIFAGIIFVFMVIYAGLKFINSDGKPEELKKVKDLLIYSGIGISFVVAAYVIIKLVVGIFGVEGTPFQ